MKTVVSMGVHILDVLGRHVSEIPPGQNIALIDEIRITAAGTAAGTSVDMAKLGCKVVAVGAAGDDEMGNVLLGIMNRYGIDTSHMKRKKGVQTSGTMLPIRPNGERPALHVMGTNATFCFEDVPQDVVKKADFVHIGGFYLMPKFDGEDTVKTLKVAREGKAITAGAKHVVLKMGARGSLIKNKEGMRLRIPAYKVDVVDTTGCGDAWTGGFIAGLSRGMTIEEAAKLGSACGSLVATGLGSDAGIIDLDSTLEFSKTNPTLPLGD